MAVSDKWGELLGFAKRRLGEIGISDDNVKKITDGLRARFVGNYTYHDNYESCKQHISLMLNNLDPESHLGSRRLLDTVNAGKLDASRLAYFGRMDMQPDVWKNDLKEIEERSKIAVEVVWTSQYVCEMCGKQQQQVKLQQLRSIDEGQTLIIRCICNHEWYVYN